MKADTNPGNGALGGEAAQEVLLRLRRIEGQIRGIQNMIAEGRPCGEVVQQLAAAKAALAKTGAHFITMRLSECLGTARGAAKDDLDQAVEMFAKLG